MIFYSPNAGFSNNPLLQANGNVTCFYPGCHRSRETLKLKNCCGKGRYVPSAVAAEIKKYYSRLDAESRQAIGLKK